MPGMESWADQQTVILKADHPDWDIWYVPLHLVGYAWCAKRKGRQVAEINADSPENLEAEIAKIERGQS